MKKHEEEIRDMMTRITSLCRDRLTMADFRRVSNLADKAVLAAKKADRRLAKAELITEGLPIPADEPYTQQEVAGAEDKKTLDRERILDILKQGRSLTQIDANKMGILRLGARIWDLRHAGYNITTTMVKGGRSRIAKYRLIA